MTIYPSGSTYIQGGSSADHSGASQLYSSAGTHSFKESNWSIAPAGAVAAVLQFTRPNALKYARIVSATLWFELDGYMAPDPSYYKQKEEYYVASYATQNPVSAINWVNFRTGGILGEWMYGGNGQIYPTPFNCIMNVTSAYTSDLSNNIVTFAITAGMGHNPPNNDSWINPNNCRLVIEYEAGSQPAPTPLYPKDITLIESATTLFSWQFNGVTEAVQTAAVLEYKDAEDESYTTINLTQSGYSYMLNQDLPPGTYQWRVKVTNDAGTTSAFSDVATFHVVGKPASPIINEPENKALTTISWNTENQQACEIILADQSGKELYHETLATNMTTFKPNFFLQGAYMFSIRVMNDSQMWSDWAQRAFVINASGPAAATLTLVTVAGSPAVHLTFAIPDDVQAVLMRSQGGNEKALKIIDQFDTEYIDATVASGITYTYWVRTYVDGYTDSDSVETSVQFEGAILNTEDTLLELNRSDEQFLPYSKEISRAFELMNFSGREYPMIERGEFTTVEFSRRFHVTYAQEKILDKLSKEESVFYRDDKDHAYPAGLKRVHYDSYMDDGYLVTIDLVRLNEEEVIVNV